MAQSLTFAVAADNTRKNFRGVEMAEKRHLWLRNAEETLCGELNSPYLTSLLEWPVEDLCLDCLEQLQIRIQAKFQEEREHAKFFFFTASEDIEAGQAVYLNEAGGLCLATGVLEVVTAQQDYEKGDIIALPIRYVPAWEPSPSTP